MKDAQKPDHVSLTTLVGHLREAALRVSDPWFTFRTQAIESITDEVAGFLTERRIVQVLSTGNRAAARGVAERVLAAWHDLNHLASGPEALTFVSLFDDTADVWAEEDFRLIEPLSTVSRWSRPDEFVTVLSEAA